MLQCIVLLLIVQFEFEFPEFKFELNVFESLSKMQNLSLSPTLFSPAQALPFLFFLFSSAAQKPAHPLLRGPKHHPAQLLPAQSAPPLPSSLYRRQAGPAYRERL